MRLHWSLLSFSAAAVSAATVSYQTDPAFTIGEQRPYVYRVV